MTWPPQLLLLEVSIVESFGDLHARDVDFGVGGNGKLLVSPAQGYSVQGKRAYKYARNKKTLLEKEYKDVQHLAVRPVQSLPPKSHPYQ